jgi:NAD(P)-dependent dehydrogenase (short-subunit alcohol dehydrogenase family)
MYGRVNPTALTAAPSAGSDAFLATTGLGRIGQPVEVERGILFLLSDQASFITASVSGPILPANDLGLG